MHKPRDPQIRDIHCYSPLSQVDFANCAVGIYLEIGYHNAECMFAATHNSAILGAIRDTG